MSEREHTNGRAGKPAHSFWQLSKFVITKLAGWRWRLPLTLALGFAEIGIIIFLPLTSAKIINSLIASSWLSFRRHLLTLLLLTLAQTLVSLVHRYFLLVNDERVGNGLRRAVVDTVLRKNLHFFERHWVGDIVSRAVNDSGVIQGFLTRNFIQIIYDGATLVVVTYILVRMNPVLGLLTVATAPVTILFGRKMRRRLEQASLRVREGLSAVTSHLQSWLSRSTAIKMHALEPEVLRRFSARNDSLTDSAVSAGLLGAGVGAVNTALLSVPSLLIFAYGGYITLNGELSIGDLFAFMTFTTYFNAPIQRLISIIVTSLPTLYPVYDRVREFLAEGDSDAPTEDVPAAKVERIEVEGLKFTFEAKPGSEVVVPSLTAKAGEVVGITGPNGSGKTTLMRLLMGIYQPKAGRIAIAFEGGTERPASASRKSFSCLPQSPALFDGTLAENVTLFDVNPDAAKLPRIERQLDMTGWIASLPRGWETEINAGLATTFSGGQVQKIGLARLLYREAPVLILDEPTNNLDAGAQLLIEETIFAPRPAQVVVVITHSRRLLSSCDRVYSLQPVAEGSASYNCSEVVRPEELEDDLESAYSNVK